MDGDELKKWRVAKGFTQAMAAAFFKVDVGTIGTWERRGMPALKATRYAHLFNPPSPPPPKPPAAKPGRSPLLTHYPCRDVYGHPIEYQRDVDRLVYWFGLTEGYRDTQVRWRLRRRDKDGITQIIERYLDADAPESAFLELFEKYQKMLLGRHD
jgi:hypothetical protein